eukprot:1350753-Rhodomonas_salina.3
MSFSPGANAAMSTDVLASPFSMSPSSVLQRAAPTVIPSAESGEGNGFMAAAPVVLCGTKSLPMKITWRRLAHLLSTSSLTLSYSPQSMNITSASVCWIPYSIASDPSVA